MQEICHSLSTGLTERELWHQLTIIFEKQDA